MSWNSIVTHFLYDEDFPKIRLGSKWLFHKKEVVRENGGDIILNKQKG